LFLSCSGAVVSSASAGCPVDPTFTQPYLLPKKKKKA